MLNLYAKFVEDRMNSKKYVTNQGRDEQRTLHLGYISSVFKFCQFEKEAERYGIEMAVKAVIDRQELDG